MAAGSGDGDSAPRLDRRGFLKLSLGGGAALSIDGLFDIPAARAALPFWRPG